MKRKSKYHAMKIADLARITRERGLDKPIVREKSEWADFLDADDAKPSQQVQAVDTDADRDTEDAAIDDSTNSKPAKKGKG